MKDLVADGTIILKYVIQKRIGGRGLNSCSSGQRQVSVCCASSSSRYCINDVSIPGTSQQQFVSVCKVHTRGLALVPETVKQLSRLGVLRKSRLD